MPTEEELAAALPNRATVMTPIETKRQIAALEATVTPRRAREAALGTDGGWLKALDAQIAALRAKL
jgi:hypothetical protein